MKESYVSKTHFGPQMSPRKGRISRSTQATMALMLLAGAFGSSAQADDFFACNTGFAFQEENGAARCFKKGRELAFDPGACLPPSQKRVDHRDNVDACVAGPIAGDMVCLDRSTRIDIRKGEDKCVRTENDVSQPPNRRVSR